MPLDAIALGAVINELNDLVSDARIEKIYQPERDEIMLSLKSLKGSYKLVISASSSNSRIHLVSETKENPAEPPMFCMLLRKHMTGGKIKSISRVGFDRIIDIEAECRNEFGDAVKRHLICEIMGRNSNIIFLDDEMKIIDSVKHIDITISSVRNILPGLRYMLPPSPEKLNPENSSENDYYNLLKKAPRGRDASRIISEGVMGISPFLAAECLFRASGSGNIMVGEMTENQTQKTAIYLYEMFEKAIKNDFSPCLIMEEGGKKARDFSPFITEQYGKSNILPVKSMNEAVEKFYFMRDIAARMHDRSLAITKIINNHLRRAEKKLDKLQCEIKEASNRDKFRIFGELLTANLYKAERGAKSIKVINYYDPAEPEIEIPLDNTKSPSENAARYFSRYKKAKNTEIYASKQLKATKSEIEYLESVLYSLKNAQSPTELAEIKSELIDGGYIRSEIKKHKKKENRILKPMEFEYGGYTIFVGKNNVQNDYLTMKMGRSRDLWLHTKNIPGSHTLIRYMGEEFPPDVIKKAAELAAYYSKGRNSGYVDVDYCPVSHVKKPPGAKSGMVIYEGYNTACVTPSEINQKD